MQSVSALNAVLQQQSEPPEKRWTRAANLITVFETDLKPHKPSAPSKYSHGGKSVFGIQE